MSARDELLRLHTPLTMDAQKQPEYRDNTESALYGYSEGVEHALGTVWAKGYRKPRTITTIGDMARLADRSVFRTAEGHVFEVQGGHLLRTDSTTWWSPLASWLPITVLDEPAATCTGADSCDAIAHVHGCFAEATR